jgi:hypothetical protein
MDRTQIFSHKQVPGRWSVGQGWVAIVASILATAALVTLFAVLIVEDQDALAAVALLLAIVAFLIQFLVFATQTIAGADRVRQSEAINRDTLVLLDRISTEVKTIRKAQAEDRQWIEDARAAERRDAERDLREYATFDGASQQYLDALSERFALMTDSDLYLESVMERGTEGSLAERVDCPQCGFETETSIRPERGASSIADCQNHECPVTRFHTHRDADGRVYGSLPGRYRVAPESLGGFAGVSIEEILRRTVMEIPPADDRQDLLKAIYLAWKQDRLTKGAEFGRTLPYLQRSVLLPLFYGVTDPTVGEIKRGDPDRRIPDQPMAAFDGVVEDQWMRRAEAAWMTQAISRLRDARQRDNDIEIYLINEVEVDPAVVRLAFEKADQLAGGDQRA